MNCPPGLLCCLVSIHRWVCRRPPNGVGRPFLGDECDGMGPHRWLRASSPNELNTSREASFSLSLATVKHVLVTNQYANLGSPGQWPYGHSLRVRAQVNHEWQGRCAVLAQAQTHWEQTAVLWPRPKKSMCNWPTQTAKDSQPYIATKSRISLPRPIVVFAHGASQHARRTYQRSFSCFS